MADTKITSLLTPQVTTNPATDVLPIVNIADTLMASSGSTRKITVNQLLGAGGTATLASATVTGALDAARLNVTASTIPANGVYLVTTNKIGFSTNSIQRLTIDATGNLTNTTTTTQDGFLSFSNTIDGGTLGYFGNARAFITGGATSSVGIRGESSVQFSIGANLGMTLNATGLGVGGSPVNPLTVFAAASAKAPALLLSTVGSPTYGWDFSVDGATTGNLFLRRLVAGTKTDVLEFDRANGNVGIGVAPSAWVSTFKAINVSSYAAFGGNSDDKLTLVGNNYYNDGTAKFIGNGYAGAYSIYQGAHRFQISTTNNSSGAGAALTFTQAMTLDASGNLLIGKTSSSLGIVGVEDRPNGEVWSTNAASTDGAGSSYILYSSGATAYRFYVGMGGTVFATNTTISAISDARLKENVQDLDVGLGAILALKPRKFDWKEGKGKNIKGDRGFIAQEFEQVFPNLIDEWKDAAPEGETPYKSVRQDLIPVLVKAIQELTARVQTLETR